MAPANPYAASKAAADVALGEMALRGLKLARLLPFILIGTVQGAFLSQQLWGSTYAIWPLLVILLAGVLVGLFRLRGAKSAWEMRCAMGIGRKRFS